MFINILIIISVLYIILIISLIIGFDKIPYFSATETATKLKFTIIIPFRNEAENISALANSLKQLNYPKNSFEIIFVNDGSTDNSVPLLTEFIINNFNWKVIDNIRKSNSPKKDAITIAIQQAKYTWIITTDADCIVPNEWLNSFSSFINKNDKIKMIAAPVSYKANNTFLDQFQLMDFISLIGTTIGSFGLNKPFMCNGANLCYSKQAFLNVNGFQGNDNISSGDDVFLLEKISTKYPNQVKYIKTTNALVITKPESNFKGLINQRIRWASKTSKTKSLLSKFVGVLVLLMNITIFWSLLFGLWFIHSKFLISIILILKLIFDYVLINKTYQFVHQKLNILNYFKSSLVYPFFIVFIVVKSTFTKVSWKG